MQNPLVSIILPTYNGSKFIYKSIDSVLNQTYTNFELIIINDASTDKVESIILEYQKKENRIIYIKNEKNIERSKSKNKWVNLSRWDYIAFIDDDDIWIDKYKISKQIKFLEENQTYWLIWTNAICVDENNNKTGTIIVKNKDYEIKNNILITNQFIQSSVLIKKDIFLKAWWFTENLNLCEDYDLWLRIWYITKLYNLSDFCLNYMIRQNNTTAKNSIKMKLISIKLIWKYKKYYKNFYIAIITRLITFFIPINIIVKIKNILK